MTGSPATLLRRAVSPARHEGSPRTVLFVMCTGYFLVLLDVTIVNVALPPIGSGLGTDIGGLQWVVDGYALALAALMLTSGTAGDLYGHRRVVLAGLVVFGAGSLACGLAPGVPVLVAARVIQGVGAALLLPGTLAIISRAFPGDAARARAIGVWAGTGSLALPAGPLLGGALTETLGWRAIFLLNVPIVLVALVWSAAIVRESREEQARRLDVPGLLLGSLLLLATTYAFIEGGRTGAGAPQVLVAAALAVLIVPTLAVVELRRGEEAMLPVALLRRPAFDAANVVAGIMNMGTLGTLFVLMLFLQSVQDRSALLAGAAVIPLFAPLAVIAPVGGRITSRLGSRLPAAAGLLLATAGLALLALAGPHSTYLVLLPAFLLWGIGMGFLTPAVVAAAIAAVPADRSGLASAMNNTARQTGGAIGIAVAGAVAGQPGDETRFVRGFHAVALGAAGLYAAAAVLALLVLPGALLPDGER
ncbi:MFS transporter [Streptomyces sp. TLI_185]|uniref:MFS transporter n=1 Tax=Streptomyces sp. TLI_185 TaxID=2485151 RepID=UPI000FAA3552|nr:MFS transporter [Streptomyces sp. TLI_185]RPF38817.1 DHA2 family methylenomycin A resistance protein-like MFS transporter [Streptomyces sp. TLI_185]